MRGRIALLTISLVIASAVGLKAQTTTPRTLSYQGVLKTSAGNIPAGTRLLTVTLYGDANGNTTIWQSKMNTPVDENGVFNCMLGNSDNPLPDPATMDRPIWLGVSVDGSPELRPLSQITASVYALNVADSSITSAKMATDYVSSISVNGQKVTGKASNLNIIGGDGVNLAYDDATNSLVVNSGADNTARGKGASAESAGNWTIGGDPLTGADIPLLGTTSSASTPNWGEIINGDSIVKYRWVQGGTPDIIGGYFGNSISESGVTSGPNIQEGGNFIGGGGAALDTNQIFVSHFATIGGGLGNRINYEDRYWMPDQYKFQTIGGGEKNHAVRKWSSILGGKFNNAFGEFSTIGGGNTNYVDSITEASTITGGAINRIDSGADYSIIGGGDQNVLQAPWSVIAGGDGNVVLGFGADHSAIGGGRNNYIQGPFSAIAGGDSNSINSVWADHNFIGGGYGNVENNPSFGVIAGGFNNILDVDAWGSSIGGGDSNIIKPSLATIGGGYANFIDGDCIVSTIGGGALNNIGAASYAFIGGGYHNKAYGAYTTIGGGYYDTSLSLYSFIGGGNNNVIYYWSDTSSIVGGSQNYIVNGPLSFIGGGARDTIRGKLAVIVGGDQNTVTGEEASILGGYSNTDSGRWSSITGGDYNHIGGHTENSIIGAGYSNYIISWNEEEGGTENGILAGESDTISGSESGIGAGGSNVINGEYGFIGAGGGNHITVTGYKSGILAGAGNYINDGEANAIAAGTGNSISVTPVYDNGGSDNSFIGAGTNNLITWPGSFIGAGNSNYSYYANYTAIPAGDHLTAQSYCQTVLGCYNAYAGNIVDTSGMLAGGDQPLVIVGNGRNVGGTLARSDAITISYNGHISAFQNLGTAGAATTSIMGTTYSNNTIVAWGNVPAGTTGAGSDMTDGIGVTSVVMAPAGVYTITLNVHDPLAGPHAFVTGHAAIVATPTKTATGGMALVTITPVTPGGTFTVTTWDVALGAPASTIDFEFHVVAR